MQITNASEVDEKVTQALFDLMARNAEVKAAVAATPMIQASVRDKQNCSPPLAAGTDMK